MSLGDFKCSGCGKELHPMMPCSAASALRRPRRFGSTQELFLVWHWQARERDGRLTLAAGYVTYGEAKCRADRLRERGRRVKIKKIKVQF